MPKSARLSSRSDRRSPAPQKPVTNAQSLARTKSVTLTVERTVVLKQSFRFEVPDDGISRGASPLAVGRRDSHESSPYQHSAHLPVQSHQQQSSQPQPPPSLGHPPPYSTFPCEPLRLPQQPLPGPSIQRQASVDPIAERRAQRESAEFQDVTDQVVTILKAIYHLNDDGDEQPPQQQPQQPNGAQDVPSTIPLLAGLPAENQPDRSALIRSWLSQTSSAMDADVPPSRSHSPVEDLDVADSPYEATLVGDGDIPSKLPDDDAEMDRASLNHEMGLRAWCSELFSRTDISLSQLKVAACYLIAVHPHVQEKLNERRTASALIAQHGYLPHGSFRVSPLACTRRTLLGALIVAGKFLHERVYSLRAWARVTGLEAPDLVQAEQAIGDALRWRLWVGGNVRTLRWDVYERNILDLLGQENANEYVRFWSEDGQSLPAVFKPGAHAPLPFGNQDPQQPPQQQLLLLQQQQLQQLQQRQQQQQQLAQQPLQQHQSYHDADPSLAKQELMDDPNAMYVEAY